MEILFFIPLAIFLVMGCLIIWCTNYDWFVENRKRTDSISRSGTSWNKEHEFFDTITEFQDDFS